MYAKKDKVIYICLYIYIGFINNIFKLFYINDNNRDF